MTHRAVLHTATRLIGLTLLLALAGCVIAPDPGYYGPGYYGPYGQPSVYVQPPPVYVGRPWGWYGGGGGGWHGGGHRGWR
jgi:hypothetical protein